jgi:hypothetical protein
MRRSLRVKKKEQAWGRTLGEIETAIHAASKKKIKTKAARERHQALLQAVVEFRGFKDAWRNHAMHGRQNYSRQQAERILGHVAAFIKGVSGQVGKR